VACPPLFGRNVRMADKPKLSGNVSLICGRTMAKAGADCCVDTTVCSTFPSSQLRGTAGLQFQYAKPIRNRFRMHTNPINPQTSHDMDSWFFECRKTPGDLEELRTLRVNSLVRTHDEREAFVIANRLGRTISYTSPRPSCRSCPTAASLSSLP
jgi:hypothetical protein